MASVNLALILFVTSLLLLSDAASLPSTADESTTAALALDAPGDANPKEVLDPRVENTVTFTEANLPVQVDGFDRVGLSLRRPFHRRRSHCHHGHRLRGREVVPYGQPGEWNFASTAAEEVKNWGIVTETNKEDEKDGQWHIQNKEHKNKKKEKKNKRAEDSDSDSDSDSDDEGMDLRKKQLRKKKGKKERGGWMTWFWALWD